MKKITKRTLALILAVVMALPVMLCAPWSASAANVTVNPNKYVLITSSSSGSRGDGNDGCIVNDGSKDNMSAMLWQFDLSGIKSGYRVDSATFSFDVWSINNKNISGQQLDVWYFNPATYAAFSGFSNDTRVTDTSLGYGDEGPASYRAKFGIEDDYYIGYRTHSYVNNNATISFSNNALVDALNNAADAGWGSIVFVIMHNKTAASRWSDIWSGIYNGKAPSLSYTTSIIPDEEIAKDKMPSYNGSNLVSTSSGIIYSGGGDAYSTNVLYSNNGNYDSTYYNESIDGDNKIGFNIYPASSRAVYMYDSDNAVIGYPLIAKSTKSDRFACEHRYGINYIAVSDSSSRNWYLDQDWHVSSGDRVWNDILSSKSDQAYGVYKVNFDANNTNNYNEDIVFPSNKEWTGHYTKETISFRNLVKLNNSQINFENSYIYTVSNDNMPTFKASTDSGITWTGCSAHNQQEKWSAITINGKQSITLKVLNVKPLKDIISSASFKSNFSSISQNEWMYTDESLNSYYSIVARILRFNINSYDYSNDTGLQAAADEIKNIVDNYSLPVKKTFTVNFKTADGASFIESRTVTAGDGLGTLPANTKAVHINSTSTHTAYYWDGITSSTVIRGNTDYTESTKTEACSFGYVHNDETAELNGHTDYACISCGNYNLADRVYDNQNWTLYDTAIDEYNSIINGTKYTSSSITAFKNAVDSELVEKMESVPQSKINNAVSTLNTAKVNLEERADMTSFDETYESADELLSESTNVAQYTKSTVDALVETLNNASSYYNADEATRSNYGTRGENSAQQTINSLEADIISAKNALTQQDESSENYVDLNTYQSMVEELENIDADRYDYPADKRASDLRVATKAITTTTTYNGQTIKVLKNNVSQSLVDAVTSLLQSSATTHIKKYKIQIAEGNVSDKNGVTFNGGTHSYDASENAYYATYGTRVNFKADSADTAWYMEFDSTTSGRDSAYAGSGKYYSVEVIGNLSVTVKSLSESNKLLSIRRVYSDSNNSPVQLTDYVSGDYALPKAPALPYYNFEGYEIDGETYEEGDVIQVLDDTYVKANYIADSKAEFAVNVEGADGSTTKAYNDKVSLKGNEDTYAWLELVKDGKNKYKPFYIGKDAEFFVTESITLKAVTEEEFISGGYKLPAINIRQDGGYVIQTETSQKVTFNGQVVTDGSATIVEYGILLGKATENGSLSANDVKLENIGSSENYKLSRFKSTKDVGAHQFTIGVTGLRGDVIYKGYIIYKTPSGSTSTVYTDPIIETL